jgi:hypothetical protein
MIPAVEFRFSHNNTSEWKRVEIISQHPVQSNKLCPLSGSDGLRFYRPVIKEIRSRFISCDPVTKYLIPI